MIKKIIIGFLAGLICGFFSTGGGMILVPGFMYVLKKKPHISRATSVFCILPMVIMSSFFYYKNNYIDWNVSILCAVGGTIGGIIGAYLLKKIPDRLLKIVFTFFLIYAAIKFLF